MAGLYDEIAQIDDAINDYLYGEDEIDITVLDNLIAVKNETIARGLESLCKILARHDLTLSALTAEIARLTNRKKAEETAITRLENYIMDVYKRAGDKKVTAGTFVVSTRTSASVYTAPDFNDPEFMRTSTTSAPDKAAIKDALKSGREIPGAYIVTKENLTIK